jgi:hypothetical protein
VKKLKLKLEELEITTFEPAPNAPQARGTLYAHAKPQPPSAFTCPTALNFPTDPDFDCTYGCSRDTGCPDQCFVIVVSDVCV